MRGIAAFVALAAPLWMVACSERDPVADNLAAANLPEPTEEAAPAPAVDQPAEQAGTAGGAAPSPAAIPAALQGRWGLTPGDCTSTRGDAKGLLVITPSELRFYESRAVPSPGAEADADSIIGNFAFTGEGQSWTKFQRIELQNHALVRTESNPAASYTYAKC